MYRCLCVQMLVNVCADVGMCPGVSCVYTDVGVCIVYPQVFFLCAGACVYANVMRRSWCVCVCKCQRADVAVCLYVCMQVLAYLRRRSFSRLGYLVQHLNLHRYVVKHKLP